MGWGAAHVDEVNLKLLRCPVCGRQFALKRSVLDHAEAKHKDPEHIRRVATWWIESVSGTPNQKEIQS